MGPPSRALDCPRSCLDPAAGGYWVYHPAEDRVSFEALPELMAAKLRGVWGGGCDKEAPTESLKLDCVDVVFFWGKRIFTSNGDFPFILRPQR